MRKHSEYTRRLCRGYKTSNAASWPCFACSMASDSVIRCFGSVKSPFPAASASDAASNSFRCTNLPRKLRNRSRPFLRCKNTKNSSLPDNPSRQSTALARHKNHFRNAPPVLPQPSRRDGACPVLPEPSHSPQETRQAASLQETGLRLRRKRLQPMAMGAGFANPQQNGEGKPNKSKDREDPHAQPVSSRILQTGVGVVVGLANQQVQDGEANLLNQCHQSIGGAQPGLVHDISDRRPHDRRNQRESYTHHRHRNQQEYWKRKVQQREMPSGDPWDCERHRSRCRKIG